jgi:hypothetical protein
MEALKSDHEKKFQEQATNEKNLKQDMEAL